MMLTVNTVQIWFGKQPVEFSDVLAWEVKRTKRALQRLGVQVISEDSEVLRSELLKAKMAQGRKKTEERLAAQIKCSDLLTGWVARLSGKRHQSQVELFIPHSSAAEFVKWYIERAFADDEAAFLVACPDHHIFRLTEDGRQEVWETTGGAPFASRFFFTLGEDTSIVTPADPTYPIQMAGTARLADGTLIGEIRHQFRDEANGVRALLTIELPWLIGPFIPAAHRWHLAREFSAWLMAAAQRSSSDGAHGNNA